MKKPAAKKAPEKKPGVAVGDQIYFQHDDGPCHGAVLSCGAHGITVDHDGAHRQVRWEHILGHRKRAQKNYRILDKGEDGSIAVDDDGNRVFLAGEIPEDDDMETLEKSVSMLKALKNAPGLSLQETTDRRGHVVKRWKRTGPEEKKGRDRKGGEQGYGAHNVASGDKVTFHHKDKSHNGHVVATGKDGATVKHAETGEHHRVMWHEISASHKSEERQPSSGEPQKLFDDKDIAGVGLTASQPVGPDGKEELFGMAAESLSQMKDWLGGVANNLGLETMKGSPDDVKDWGKKGGMLFIAPIKSEKRSAEKVGADYGGDWSKLLDVVRATIAVDTMSELKDVVSHLKSNGLKLARLPKDRFIKPTGEGYRDLLLNIELPNGMIGELQVHVKPMLDAKSEGHAHYEVTRTLQGKYGEDEPTDKWDEADHTAFYDAKKAQQKIYSKAWEKASGAHKNEEQTLSKSLPCSNMIMLFLVPEKS